MTRERGICLYLTIEELKQETLIIKFANFISGHFIFQRHSGYIVKMFIYEFTVF